MRLSASLSLLAATAAAHEGYQGPRLFGAPGLKMPRGIARDSHRNEARAVKEARQDPVGGTDGRCGPDFGGASCAEGYCCSDASWCGKGNDYCSAPDCQYAYGSGCATNQKPSGADTTNVARPHVGNVAYGGAGLYHCTVPGTVALTYDDGPYIYTDGLLDLLDSYGAKATFFITGNNIGKGPIDTTPAWATVIQRMANEGHQVASHTWSHQNLDQVSAAVRTSEIVYNEIAFNNILGYFPTYMRPPYSACIEQPCMDQMSDLGYHITYFDVDTDDYNNLTPELIQNAKDNFENLVKTPTSNKYLAIAHDIHELSAVDLTKFMLDQLKEQGFKAVTVGECLGDPIENWYRGRGSGGSSSSSSSSSSSTKPTDSPSNTDGSGSVSATPTDTDGPAPTDTDGPAPTDTDGPAPTDTDGPAPTDTDGPAPTDTDGPAPTGDDGSGSEGPAPTGGCRKCNGGGSHGPGDDDSEGGNGGHGSHGGPRPSGHHSSAIPSGSGNPTPPTPPSATPPKPTGDVPPAFTGAASINQVGGLVAAMAIAVAAF